MILKKRRMILSISIAVAGFSDADLNVEVKNKTLIISGKKT